MWETIKYSTINILPYIPKIGTIASTVVTVYDGIAAVYTDIKSFDTSSSTNEYTRYAYQYYYHTGYVWDYDNSWKFEGESTSKYYYKISTFDCIVNGVSTTRTLPCIESEGYLPTVIAKAPNYMNYSSLSNIFYEKWVGNQAPYYETY